MRTDDFDFELPPERIALRPAVPRDSARLLVVRPKAGFVLEAGAAGDAPGNRVAGGVLEERVESGILEDRAGGALEDRLVRDLPDLLRPGDMLVVNDTKVILARLSGRRIGGATEPAIEATLIRRLDGSRWQALAKPARKLKPGDVVRFGDEGSACFLGQLDATVEGKGEAGEVTLAFAFHGAVLDQAIAQRGEVPLPPYIAARRAADARDRSDYQTVFARMEGAVAAPTAGLHFTDGLARQLAERGVELVTVTLHVGAGTFLPVRAEDTSQHEMHAEWGELAADAAARLNAARARGFRIVAVGTTSLRLIESAAREDGTLAPFAGETSLFIAPGYRFRAADILLTNFHLPRSTLFMLVAAFSGLGLIKRAYAHAIEAGYRFYSYGDACLLFRDNA
jgi:S-adenosylmethionine:tRNA ribosyltransferase-isomerase